MLVHGVVRILPSSTKTDSDGCRFDAVSCVDLVCVLRGAVAEVTSQLRAILSRRRHVAALKKHDDLTSPGHRHRYGDQSSCHDRKIVRRSQLAQDACQIDETTAGEERSAFGNVLNRHERAVTGH